MEKIKEKDKSYDSLKMICANCTDFESETNFCTIRYVVTKDRKFIPMSKRPGQKGCKVFINKNF